MGVVKNFKYTPILHNEYIARQEARDKSNNKSSLAQNQCAFA